MGYLFFATRARSTVGAHQAAQAVAFGISYLIEVKQIIKTSNYNQMHRTLSFIKVFIPYPKGFLKADTCSLVSPARLSRNKSIKKDLQSLMRHCM